MNTAKNYNDQEKINIVRRLLSGENAEKLASELGIASFTLYNWRTKFGSEAAKIPRVMIAPRPENRPAEPLATPEPKTKAEAGAVRYSAEDRAWALEEVRSGTKITHVCETLGCSHQTYKNWEKAAKAKLKAAPKEQNVTPPAPPPAPQPTPTPPPVAVTPPAPAAPTPPELPKRSSPIPDTALSLLAREIIELKLAYAEAGLEIRRLRKERR